MSLEYLRLKYDITFDILLIDIISHDKEIQRKHKYLYKKCFLKIIKEILMLTIILFVTGHEALIGIYNCNYLLLPHILYFLHLQ